MPKPRAGEARPDHPRTIGWLGTTALAMGGSNQSLFIIAAVVAAQGTAAVPLLVVGWLLSFAAAPGWIELILMWPDRVGGIAATCAEAFRPYSPVLANLTGVCYWWGWIPTCGVTAILSASALHEWYLPGVPITLLASAIVLTFLAVNLCGIRWVTRLAIPVALCSAGLAFLSALVPVLAGTVDWHRATSFVLQTPFRGWFGSLTSAMGGLYLIGFAAPAFEAAACHVGETRDPNRNVPRAMFAAGAMAALYFIVLPVIWLGVIGPTGMSGELTRTLAPTYAPLLVGAAKAAAVWFMVMNMFHGTLQPLAGAARTLSQLSEDGLLPRLLARRNRNDVPWIATVLTAGVSIAFLLVGDPVWLIAAANLAYLIGICLPSVAVWLLRRNAPEMERPFRAPHGTIGLGLVCAAVWGSATIFGFEQYGLPTVLAGIALAYAGSTLYAWRAWRDRVALGGRRIRRSLHFKLTGAMLAVIVLDGAGYLLAVSHIRHAEASLTALLADIFVTVAVLTIAVGLVLPGMIANTAREVAAAAMSLANGTVRDLTRAMEALSRGQLSAAYARADPSAAVPVRTRDEVGLLAESFNVMHREVAGAALALDGAREGLRASEQRLERNVAQQAAVAALGQLALESLDFSTVMREAAGAIHEVMGLDAVAVLEHDLPGGAVLTPHVCIGLAEEMADIPVAEALLEEAGHARGPLTLGVEADFLRRFDARSQSALLTPIVVAEQLWGVLVGAAHDLRAFTRDEIDFVHAIGNVLSEAIQRIRSIEEIRRQALHDPLTGLPNRVLFVDHLALALAQTRRRRATVGVLFLDLDYFKFINDSLGHSAGDEVLRTVAQRLDCSLRPGDTVARFGGDEFVMVCTDLTDASDAAMIARRLADTLMVPFRIGDIEHRVSASIGIATSDGPERSAEDLVREADAAMYRAKERGRNRYESFDEHMRVQASHRLRVANDLAQALERGELHVEYQPIVSLVDGTVAGAEALVRWNHPLRGPISPSVFIQIAEESGTIVPIGEFVLREACHSAAAWHRARPQAPPVVSVNISPRQVRHTNLPETVASVLSETGIDPRWLQLEITESVLMEESELSLRCLHALKELGVSLVLDDFGTGYSSLAYVKRFPIDVIKIDRSFIGDLEHGDRDATIVEAIVYMARGLRLKVVAEGVETPVQAASLRDLGCDLAQGWLFAPSLSAVRVGMMLDHPLTAARG